MLDTEESSSDTDADWRKLESKNPYLRLMALGKAKNSMGQYLNQDIDGLDVKLLFGVYQRKVLGYEERVEEITDILDKIMFSKRMARQLYQLDPNKVEVLPNVELEAPSPQDDPIPPIEEAPKKDKFAKNDASLKAKDKSYLAQFYIKPTYNVDQS